MADLDVELRWSSEAGAEDSAPAAAALRRSVAALVLDKAAEGIWLIDAEARTTFVNRRIADLLGYSESEMIGQHVFTFLDPARWPVAAKNLQARRLGIEDRQEVELIRRDGTRIWVLGSANPVFDKDGKYAGALGVVGDLTVQKERERGLEAEIALLRSRLAARSQPDGRQASETPPYREPFRTAIVLAACGTFLASVAVLTVGGVLGSVFGRRPAESGE